VTTKNSSTRRSANASKWLRYGFVSGRFQQNTPKRPEQVELERDRPLSVGDGKIDVM
jgi:hypothetical protein